MPARIELLAARHDRANFDCGEPALNEFLQRQAGQQQRSGFGKTYVALADDGVTVTGFVTLSAGQVATQQLPATLKLPRYPAPVLRIGRLAVDSRQQGRGIGQELPSFAIHLAREFAQRVVLYAVLVDAKNDKVKAFYAGLGFLSCVDQPLCLFLPLATLDGVQTQ